MKKRLAIMTAVSGGMYGGRSRLKTRRAWASQAPVSPGVSVNAVIVALVEHASHVLWDVEGEKRAPKSDQERAEIEHHAIQLAAAGPLIALGGTGPADSGWAQLPDWKKDS